MLMGFFMLNAIQWLNLLALIVNIVVNNQF
jgi:hypothetical protein